MAVLVILFAVLLLLPSSMANNILYEGETLKTGQTLTEGVYTLTMQTNCNLVLSDNGHAVWSSNTGGKGTNCYLSVQTDGNLVIYDKATNVIWSSDTWSRWGGPYILILQRNRNVVLYDSKWSTNTYTANSEGVVIVKKDHNDTSITAEVVVPAADEPTNRKIAMVTNN
ncbi:mannose-specific lectin-like [Zingiber officinale]|uniref:Bulb-type lectin domain-containing protein n=1 Tax=Zingiber officinale TaxID=94328 RepID=A0A8J5EP51_ZINOF|nr:mannose-specific lectin-like [Zingiber officinale]KAG6468556.1 hypothetical protein ZIOFF_073244 [Zingiber officinale]